MASTTERGDKTITDVPMEEASTSIDHEKEQLDGTSISKVKEKIYVCPIEQCKDMIFDNLDDATFCYMVYARRVGFGIRVNHTRLSQPNKLLIGVDYACSREGKPKQKDQEKLKRSTKIQSETKIRCKAMMGVSLRHEIGTWVVTRFVVDHNHELYSPMTTSLLRGHRKITPAQKNLINVLNEAGIPPKKIMSVLSQGSGGETNDGCVLNDIQNHIGNKSRELLKEGDAQRMYDYFVECQSKNPGFVYSIQIDDNNRMGNYFWADTRSRVAYQYFGDVVTFDATYLTNRYGMSFVPFTGVNHHHQSIMFGCALLVSKTTSSYVWLLRTWLEAMSDCAPSVIIIDEDQ